MNGHIDWRAQNIDPDRVGIPTEYGGTLFRSRLESRWAAMFDLLKWPWEYEPLDLSGYVPDFVLAFSKPLLVEVKPALTFEALGEATRKICLSGWRGDFLVVGALIFETSSGEASAGRLSYWGHDGLEAWYPEDHAVFHTCTRCSNCSLHHASAGWQCVACGFADGAKAIASVSRADVVGMWREAGNRVQWTKGL